MTGCGSGVAPLKPPKVQAHSTTVPTVNDARMLRMPNSTSGPAFAKVKRAFRFAQLPCGFPFVLAVWLTCGSCVHTSALDAAVARAQARLVRACGLEADPSSVRWVRGYVECGGVEQAVGCANTTTRDVRVSRMVEPAQLEQIVLHELLHLLGARHVPAGHGIMAASASSAVNRVTAEDLAAVPCVERRAE